MAQISVIIPVYNVEKYLEECIESVLNQEIEDIEVICVDDGSTDKSLSILKKFGERDKRITIISQMNHGQAHARNRGLECATGKYICFVDSDDLLVEGALKCLYDTAEEKQVEIVSYETELLYETDELRQRDNKDFYYYKSGKYTGIKSGKEYFVEMMEQNDYCDSVWLLFLKRDWLLKNKILFDYGIYYEDVLFCLKCYWNSEKVYHLNQKKYIYRVRNQSTMTSKPHFINVYSCIVNFKESLKLLLNIEGDQERLKKALARYIQFICFRIRNLDQKCGGTDVFTLDNPIDSLLEECFEVGSKRVYVSNKILLAGLEKIVYESEGVVLYGAGKVGNLVYRFLCDVNLRQKIICFAVSEAEAEAKSIDGMPVKDIRNIDLRGCLVLLTAGRGIQKEMIELLGGLGVRNYEGIDRYMEKALTDYFDGGL